MMIRRLIAVLLALCLLPCMAALAEGEEVDLSPMFDLIDTEGSERQYRSVVSTPMPHNRVVIGSSLTYEKKTYTTDEILAAVPNAMVQLGANVTRQDAGLLNPETVELYGLPAVHAKVNFSIETEGGELPLCGEVYVLPIQDCLLENWILSPDPSVYEGNETALTELEEDLAIARSSVTEDDGMRAAAEGHVNLLTGQVLLRPSSATTEAAPLESETYTDPDGYFTMSVPKNAVILTPHSTDEEIAAVREHFVGLFPEAGDRLFDLYTADIRKEGGTLIFTEDFRGLTEIFREAHPEYKDRMTLKTLASGNASVAKNLILEYGEAVIVTSYETETISEQPHTRAVFGIKCGDVSMKMAMLDTFTEDCVLWEADVFAMEDALFDSLYRLTVDTLTYLPQESTEAPAAE